MAQDCLINDRFLWKKTLSAGSESTVFLVEDQRNKNTPVVLKIVPSSNGMEGQCPIHLRDEFQFYASLRHPAILPVLDFDWIQAGEKWVGRENPSLRAGKGSRLFFIVMPFIDGLDLYRAAKTLPEEDLFTALYDVTCAIDFLHRHGFVHRDIKPTNILYSPTEKKTYLLDFGLAHLGHTSFETFSGTLEYSPQEAYVCGALDARTDIYSLALCIYKLFFQTLPFATTSTPESIMAAHRQGLALDFSKKDTKVPKDLIDFIQSAIQPQPWKRPQTLLPLIDLLKRHLPPDDARLRRQNPPAFGQVGFIGRELLFENLQNHSNSASCAFFLQGEEGIGKTRTLQEIRNRLLVEGDRQLFYFNYSDLSNQDFLATFFHQLGLSKTAVEMGSEPGLVCAQICQHLHATKNSKLVFIFDDVHALSLKQHQQIGFFFRFLDQFHHQQKQRRSLTVVMAADISFDFAGFTGLCGTTQQMTLNAFSATETHQFLQHILGEQTLPERFHQEVMQLCAGNPAMIRLYLDGFLEDGSLTFEQGHFQWHPQRFVQRKQPPSVKDFLRRKLNNLPEGSKALLAILGLFPNGFSHSDLIPFKQEGIDSLLTWALRTGLLVKESNGYRFQSESLRQSVLDLGQTKTLKQIRLQRIHHLQQNPALTFTQKREIAGHFIAMGNTKEAFNLLVECGYACLEKQLLEETIRLFQEALALDRDPAKTINVAIETLRLLVTTSRYAEAEQLVSGLAKNTYLKHMSKDQRMEHLSLQLQVQCRHDRHVQAVEFFEKQKTHIETLKTLSNQSILARIQGQMAMAHLRLGNKDAAQEMIEQALKLVRKTRDRYQEIVLECHRGEIALQKSFIKQAKQIYRNAFKRLTQSKKRLESIRGLRLSASILNNLGKIAFEEGKTTQAIKFYQESLKISETIGNLSEQSNTLIHLGNIHYRQNDFKNAKDFYGRSLKLCRLLDRPYEEAINLFNLGNISFMAGQLQHSLDLHQQSLTIMKRIGNALGITNALCALAIVDLEIGDFQEVLKSITTAEKIVKEQKLNFQLAYLKFLRGLLARNQKMNARAREYFRIAESAFLKLGHEPETAQVYAEWAELELLEGSFDQALKLCAQAEIIAKKISSADILIQIDIVRAQADPEWTIESLRATVESAQKLNLKPLVWRALMVQAQKEMEDNAGDVSPSSLLKRARQLLIDASLGLSDEKRTFFWNNTSHQVGLRKEEGDADLNLRQGLQQPEATIRFKNEALKHSLDQLNDLFQINHLLNSLKDLPDLLDGILDTAIRLLRAQRGLILLKDEKGALGIACGRNLDQTTIDEPESSFSYSIAQKTINEQRTIITQDACSDERFSKELSVNHLKLRSVLSLPLKSRGNILGAIYIDNPHRRGAFNDEDVKLVEIVSDQAALALDNARMRKALEDRIEVQNAQLQQAREDLTFSFKYDRIIGGQSKSFRNVLVSLQKIEPSVSPVVLMGDRGTGKELFAKTIHYHSTLKEGPFIAGNCAALSPLVQESMLFGHVKGAVQGTGEGKKGLFELANGGTLYLKEIHELTPVIQAKIVRALQEGEIKPLGANYLVKVQVRLIVSTTKPLHTLVETGAFRRDLYGLIRSIEINIPSLKERREDIPLLVKHFLQEITKGTKSISPDAGRLLLQYDWPGNVEEMRLVLERAWTLADHPQRNVHQILPEDLPIEFTQNTPQKSQSAVLPFLEAKKQFEKDYLADLLRQYDGNITRAAAATGLYRQYLHRLLKKHNLAKDEN